MERHGPRQRTKFGLKSPMSRDHSEDPDLTNVRINIFTSFSLDGRRKKFHSGNVQLVTSATGRGRGSAKETLTLSGTSTKIIVIKFNLNLDKVLIALF